MSIIDIQIALHNLTVKGIQIYLYYIGIYNIPLYYIGTCIDVYVECDRQFDHFEK